MLGTCDSAPLCIGESPLGSRRAGRVQSHSNAGYLHAKPRLELSCDPRPPNVPLLRALWSLLDGIWALLQGSWGVLDYPAVEDRKDAGIIMPEEGSQQARRNSTLMVAELCTCHPGARTLQD